MQDCIGRELAELIGAPRQIAPPIKKISVSHRMSRAVSDLAARIGAELIYNGVLYIPGDSKIMPITGPRGRLLYSAHEAYNVMGERRYGDEWEGRFTGRVPIPDLDLMRRLSDQGEELPGEIRDLLQDENPQHAEHVQAQSRREVEVFKLLLEAARGKAACWLKDREWRVVLPDEWNEGTDTAAQLESFLREDIIAVLRDGRQWPNRLLIDKADLDRWLGYVTPVNQQSLLVLPKPRRPGRPDIDKPALLQEFHRRREPGFDIPRGWRSRMAEDLARWYQATHPEAAAPKRGLQARSETIRSKLKAEFDEYERMRKADKLPDKI